MEYLTLGKIIDTFALDGSVKIFSTTSNQGIRYKKGNEVLISINEELKTFTIASYKKSGNFDVVRFNEITSIDEATSLKGKEILVIKNQNDLKEGYYFYSDLRGCAIISEGKKIGEVTEVEEFPAQITLRCKATNGRSFFVPFVKQFIKEIRIESKEIEINYMEGML